MIREVGRTEEPDRWRPFYFEKEAEGFWQKVQLQASQLEPPFVPAIELPRLQVVHALRRRAARGAAAGPPAPPAAPPPRAPAPRARPAHTAPRRARARCACGGAAAGRCGVRRGRGRSRGQTRPCECDARARGTFFVLAGVLYRIDRRATAPPTVAAHAPHTPLTGYTSL